MEENSYKIIQKLEGHENSIRSLIFDFNSNTLFSGAQDAALGEKD